VAIRNGGPGEAGGQGGGAGTGNSNGSGFSSLSTILGIAATLIVAVFAALGVSGNLLARMVRDDPYASRDILLWGIGMVAIAALIAAIPKLPNWLIVVPVAGLGIVLGFAAHAAAVSQDRRENPTIALSLSHAQSGGLTLTVKATGSSLKSNDRLLLRVTALTQRPALEELPGSTANDKTSELEIVSNQECKRPELHPLNANSARLLSWTETGANLSGDAAVEQTLSIPPKAQYVCAWAILSARPPQPREDAPEDFALIDLEDMRVPEQQEQPGSTLEGRA
jgi:hypothetical protein